MRALVRKDDGDVSFLVEVDEGLPYGAELIKILLDGRPADRVARAVFPRPAVVAADIELKFGRVEVERHGVARKEQRTCGKIAALLGKLKEDGLEADAPAVLGVCHVGAVRPRFAAVRALVDGRDGRFFERGVVERCKQRSVLLPCIVQLDDARIEHAAAGIDFLFFGSHHNAEELFVEF